ncbi:glycine zipper 2TM domain-containing protein [Polaromonas sp.]|uniref:glycine zipper 2TM domain-containing protein n=1 Tax=Polaromonas sp. TaxID=1869339 RepID=UPI002FCB92AB
MRILPTVSLLLASSLIAGCAAPRQPVNYGHPALNQAAPAVQNEPGRVMAGALLGGLVGSRFGQGDGRVTGAAAGAAVGSMAAQGGYSNEAAGGALLGGLVGSRFGGGDGRTAAAAVGAGLGAWLAVPRD